MNEDVIRDLAKSTLTPEDVGARMLQTVECAAVGIPGNSTGYVIPYFDMTGKPRAFYRVRLFNSTVKYRQPKNTSNTLYFPKNLMKVLDASQGNYMLLVEGEKKAAAAVKAGIPAVALGGVDSWKNRTFIIPEGTDMAKAFNAKDINIKIPAGSEEIGESGLAPLATGFLEWIDFCVARQIHIIVCFDTDEEDGWKFDVQRAAASLAYELRYRGVAFSHIHKMVLPKIDENGKTGVDDYLAAFGGVELSQLIAGVLNAQESTFPQHPNVREYVNRKLQKTKMTRKEAQSASLALLSDLDTKGRRLRSESESQMYYFDHATRRLIKVSMNAGNKGLLHESLFGQLLYQRYGLSAADGRVLTWLDAQFNAEQPIEDVNPHRIVARPRPGEDTIRYQINDGQYVKVSPSEAGNGVVVLQNGDEGFLFESGLVEGIDAKDLMAEIARQRQLPLYPWWIDVLNTVRLRRDEKNKVLISLLYYISPWLYKWRGSQLPVELVIGESGSGKSSLCEHRLNIITGKPELRNAPTDLRDWQASITNAGGLHVTDNVNLVDKNLRQRLSDEICRLVTEPDPHIEMRKLYSNNELIRVPARVVFALTAIQQPFQQADLLQRAIVVELDKNASAEDGNITYEYSWVDDQMQKFGGRIAWVAHHLLVLEKFLTHVQTRWRTGYRAQHRLINVEQALIMMAEVFGQDGSWIADFLSGSAALHISESDWVVEGLKAFADSIKAQNKPGLLFSASDIANWAKSHDDFEECGPLINSRKVSKYMQVHAAMVNQMIGIVQGPKRDNRQMFKLRT